MIACDAKNKNSLSFTNPYEYLWNGLCNWE